MCHCDQYFTQGLLTTASYKHFLENDLQVYLQNGNMTNLNKHDGTPPHICREVIGYLNPEYQRKWIGRDGPVSWPAGSQDLPLLGSFMGLYRVHQKHLMVFEI
jgi:hypothetical protein